MNEKSTENYQNRANERKRERARRGETEGGRKEWKPNKKGTRVYGKAIKYLSFIPKMLLFCFVVSHIIYLLIFFCGTRRGWARQRGLVGFRPKFRFDCSHRWNKTTKRK